MTIYAPDAVARFSSMSLDGYAPGHNQPGKCTRWVWGALGAFQNTTALGYAQQAWDLCPLAHRHAVVDKVTRVPAGAVVSLGKATGPRWAGDANWMYGDVVIATGEGVGYDTVVKCTDSLLGLGIISTMTLRQRIAQTARPLNGWQSSYGGKALTFTKPNPANPAKPIIPKEDTVAVKTLLKSGAKVLGGIDGTWTTFGSSAELAEFCKGVAPEVIDLNIVTFNKYVRKAVS